MDNIIENQNITSKEKKINCKLQVIIDKLHEYINCNASKEIYLLKNKEVIQWIFGDLSFLPKIDKKNKTIDDAKSKLLEDKWGQDVLKIRRPDLKLNKQWTNKFGEYLCEEIYILIGKKINKPIKKEHHQPDYEIEDAIIEVKTGTYYTHGTAYEKILGCPFKYADIPELYAKKLKIMCIGGAENICRTQYGNLDGVKCNKQKRKFLNFFKENKIEYIGATDILKLLICNENFISF